MFVLLKSGSINNSKLNTCTNSKDSLVDHSFLENCIMYVIAFKCFLIVLVYLIRDSTHQYKTLLHMHQKGIFHLLSQEADYLSRIRGSGSET